MLLFVGSGCSALIYELVWFQWLGLIIGVSAISLGILLATFLGGMGLGAWLLPRWLAVTRHPLRVYAGLEGFIGGYALILAFAIPALARFYPGFAEPGAAAVALRAVFAALLLLPPTMAMGATLPIIARWVGRSRRGMARLGLFYGGNIAGAALGAVLAGFLLLPLFDAFVATAVAVLINLAVGGLALILARALPDVATDREMQGELRERSETAGETPVRFPAALGAVVLISGATALACQVIWTRHLSLFIGATVYGFALILAVFLVGLGIGTTIGSTLGRRLARPALALAACQALLGLAIAWAAFAVTQQLPYWPVNEELRLPADAVRAAWALLPATVLWGASFPLALATLPGPREASATSTGRTVGRLYALNTLGAILGALGATLLGIPLLGSDATQQLLVAAAGLSALLALLLAGNGLSRRAVAAVVVIAVSVLAVRIVPPIPAQVIAAGHYLPDWGRGVDVIYAEEGVTASVAVSREPNGALTYHNSGKVQASSYPRDMRLQRMLGHLTTLLPERREDFLVIGLGAGVTAGALAADPAVERITIAEIEPLVTRVAGRWFRDWNGAVTGDPRVQVVVEDGRHYLQHTDRTFDGITSDPLDPWTRGSAALYTEEFWRLAKSRLRAGGVVTAWGQLYESTEESARSVIATFMSAFPNSAIFANTVDQRGYDLVLVGMADGETLAVDRLIERVNAAASIGASLESVGIDGGLDLLGTFAGRPSDLADWLDGAQINRDRDLRLQYLAGWGSKRYDQAEIFDAMLSRGVAFPQGWFRGDPEHLATLEALIEERQGRTH
ncbi:MAG: fused MFS/spermidine synthase [Xanthomonadales bacterium]|nr:fused MFS/spermidine synthase [Xanthomonadales bacterium]